MASRILSRARRLGRASRRFGAAPRLAVAERSARYAELSSDDVAAFRTMTSSVLEGFEACRPYNVDWMSKWEGRARVVLRPASTAEVSAILRYCDARRLAVVPQGGKTGLVGGSVPVHDEVVLSLARMDRIEAFDADTGVATLEAHAGRDDALAFAVYNAERLKRSCVKYAGVRKPAAILGAVLSLSAALRGRVAVGAKLVSIDGIDLTALHWAECEKASFSASPELAKPKKKSPPCIGLRAPGQGDA